VQVLRVLRQRAAGEALHDHKWPSLVLSLMTCFSGGVFLASCFLHLLPDVK
jgi:hypothetical protein